MIYGMCFDGSVVRGRGDDGRWLHFSNTWATGHKGQMEDNYQRARQMGLTLFRDTTLWDEANRCADSRWLDRLQAVSKGQIELAMNHYGLPEWITETMFWDGSAEEAMFELAYQIAHRYRGAFRSYNVGVELGIWTDWIARPNNRQWPFGGRDWWTVYRQTSAITIAIAKGLKSGDPACLTSMSEPWGWGDMPYSDQARPFATILGQRDEIAELNDCHTWQDGHGGLLDIVGLNIYFDNDIPRMLAAARQLFPDKKVVVAETANIYRPDCHPPVLWWAKFEALNEAELEVSWNPGYPMLTHELGEPMFGYLLSEDGTQHWHIPAVRHPLTPANELSTRVRCVTDLTIECNSRSIGMMTLADASIRLDELTGKLNARPEGPSSQEGALLIDQWVGPLQEVESTQPIAATLTKLKSLLDNSDPDAQQQTLQTLTEQISELGIKMGMEGEIPGLLEGLSTTLRQSGNVSKADSAD